jgi:putative hydrolase of the HAD superfamily
MANERPPTATVFVDADNTLWDTNQVYADAQSALLAAVEAATGAKASAPDRLGFVRELDQELAERHHSGLRYPPTLLAHALALTLRGDPAAAAVRRALKDLDHGGGLQPEIAAALADRFFADLKAVPAARPGVALGLQTLRRADCLVIVVTEGARDRIVQTAEDLGLSSAIDRVVEAPKQTRLYERVAQLSNAPAPMFMVGDQLQRDIEPAKAAGLETIYFPGAFTPRWEPAADTVRPDHTITSFERVPQIVAARLALSRASAGAPGA